MKHWVEGHWYLDNAHNSMIYIRPGEYDIELVMQPAFELDTYLLPGLFQAAMDSGVLPITPSREARTEDLKIIHRLLDLMGKVR